MSKYNHKGYSVVLRGEAHNLTAYINNFTKGRYGGWGYTPDWKKRGIFNYATATMIVRRIMKGGTRYIELVRED